MKTSTQLATALLLLSVLSFEVRGQTLTTLCVFNATNGAYPWAALIQGTDGNFYGTTYQGGNLSTTGGTGYGTVFRISPSGDFTNLYSFSGSDGAFPYGPLVEGSDGNFYGTTDVGGTSTNCGGIGGCGTVFRITSSGSLTTIHSFNGYDGATPQSGLVQGSDGYLYGTATTGGLNNNGSVFRISPSGDFTNLYLFSGPDGAWPLASLVPGGDGDFYGVTVMGGTSTSCSGGCGTVFRISPSGDLTSLHSFSYDDGKAPQSPLAQGSDGWFYGTAYYGGSHSNSSGYGTIYKINPSGTFTNLHIFDFVHDARNPNGLVQGSDGNFYGTTHISNLQGMSTIFAINSSGAFTNLFNFYNVYFAHAYAGLVQGSDGSFYGTTYDGATNFPGAYKGTIFKVSFPLNPPANQISGIQQTGSNLVFSVPSVAGETYQLQFTADLASGTWSNLPRGSVTNSIGALLTVTNIGATLCPQGFYRFAITP
jgi:uncharacterized repeat protein (TIGR03803 family)